MAVSGKVTFTMTPVTKDCSVSLQPSVKHPLKHRLKPCSLEEKALSQVN